MKKNNPLLALTMGDPAGVGPEIIAGAWKSFFLLKGGSGSDHACRPVVFGSSEIIRRAVELRNTGEDVISISSLSELDDDYFIRFGEKTIPCFDCCPKTTLEWFKESCARNSGLPEPKIDPRCGDAAFICLNRAIDFALSGQISAIVTGPLHKKSLNLAGHHYPGHTEILAERCGIDDFAMMLYLGAQPSLASPTGLAVVHTTLHTAMKNVFDQITEDAVVARSHLIAGFMKKIMGSDPKIGVCALNCHNGEEGLFGDEEIRIIRPAVERAKKEGLNIAGPYPSDTLMLDAKKGFYDGIVAMYHDQGHIAVKLLDMHHAVNITLGLPIIRTSVAHGTAFDRAWKGIAEITSMIEAVRVAMILSRHSD
ncbi:MAG: 4-hydroxythreonine-4-phosphate dehydrogenase PdxA [Planctomycetia bacterium]|nr:4-hydroxythreonine-4-phosphate dehydrogenase PdxA [Planctomycetia bacterium]